MSDESVYRTAPKYSPCDAELTEVISRLSAVLCKEMDWNRVSACRMRAGQNLNIRLMAQTRHGTSSFLLRIVTRKGYPCLNNLHKCYKLLSDKGIKAPEICFADESSEFVPYGYFVQSWVEGIDAQERFRLTKENTGESSNLTWLQDFVRVLRRVHTIRPGVWGALAEGQTWSNLDEYYINLERAVTSSFGYVFRAEPSIRALESYGLLEDGTIDEIMNSARYLAERLVGDKLPVLIHGDAFPPNLVYTPDGPVLIDWDEARGGWWVQELARILYYFPSQKLRSAFRSFYEDDNEDYEVDAGIRLEHVRQHLRVMMMWCFNNPPSDDLRYKLRAKADEVLKLLKGVGQ